MTVAAASPGITVAGRTFRPVTSRPDGKLVFDQYNWVTTALWAVDLTGVSTLKDIMGAVAASGKTAALLAGLVTEETAGAAEPWTVDRARRLERFFAGPQDLGDCLTMQALVLESLAGFFPGALGSSGTSVPASAERVTPASISAIPPSPETTSASSAELSDASPAGTPTSSPA